MEFRLCTIFLAFQILLIFSYTKQADGTREGFKSHDQLVVTVNPEGVTATDDPASASSASNSSISSLGSKKKRKDKKRPSASKMMRYLKRACRAIREFSAGSKFAKELVKSPLTSEMLTREFKQLDTEDQCGFAPYSASLRIFLKTCSIIDSCSFPSINPPYKFKIPNSGTQKNSGQLTTSKVSQSYVAVPNVFAPSTTNVNKVGMNRGGFPRPVLSFARLPSSLPNWIPVVQMMQMQQAARRVIARQLQERSGIPTPTPLRATTPESDGTD